jgi:hypothetical protein
VRAVSHRAGDYSEDVDPAPVQRTRVFVRVNTRAPGATIRSQRQMSPKIVLSFPFEGGFYYLLNQHLSWVPDAAIRAGGYYSVLFGAQANLTKAKSVGADRKLTHL